MEDGELVVIRANYLGNLAVETATGSMWCDGGWMLWVLIWRGHMVCLEPPAGMDQAQLLDQWQPYDTPALGFLFFWHSRHDQERTSPGRVVCRLRKGCRKAGDQSIVDPCVPRKVSKRQSRGYTSSTWGPCSWRFFALACACRRSLWVRLR